MPAPPGRTPLASRKSWRLFPDEFRALPAKQRQRLWRRCYVEALPQPAVWLPLIGLGLVAGVVFWLLHTAISPSRSGLSFLSSLLVMWLMIGVYMVYVILLLRDKLRRLSSARCCQTCLYDLTGNETGICPECGTPWVRDPTPSQHSASASA